MKCSFTQINPNCEILVLCQGDSITFTYTELGKFCQCSKVEYTEIVILPAQRGGLGWGRKDYGYAFQIFNVECCEFKSVWVSIHLASKFI